MPDPSDAELIRLAAVVRRLRVECPWDAEQTHRSLVNHLVEEAAEVVDAVEAGPDDASLNDTDLREELGDLLCQVYFHSSIAEQQGRFTLGEVAHGITEKLVQRHPHVFSAGAVPDDLAASWEARKKAEKGRQSALDGIPDALNVLGRAAKVVGRSRSHGVPLALPTDPITADEVGEQMLTLVARAQACGVDPDQATRDALRALEQRLRDAETKQR